MSPIFHPPYRICRIYACRNYPKPTFNKIKYKTDLVDHIETGVLNLRTHFENRQIPSFSEIK